MKTKLLLTLAITLLPLCVGAQDNEADEKKKALEFLQKNMNGCYSLKSDNLSRYYSYMKNIFEEKWFYSNDQFRSEYRSALNAFPYTPTECDTVYDKNSVTMTYLQDNIELAYKMWKRNSHATSFETFCNYVLPYRIGYEPISDWRAYYIERYGDAVKLYFSKQHNYYYVYGIHNRLNRGFNGAVYYPSGPIPEFSLKDLVSVKLGNCESYSNRTVAQLRAFGIPATVDFVPQWGNRSMGHSWAVMFVDDDYTLPVGVNETLGSHFDERAELTMPKVYRQTFAIQDWLKDFCKDEGQNTPDFLKGQRVIDVTDKYVETSDVTVPVKDDKWIKNSKWIYIAAFNNRQWVPVYFSKNNGKEVVFHKMGRNIMYIAFCYDEFGRRHYATNPFLLDGDGHVRYLEAKNDKVHDITVTRKYWESDALKQYNRQIEGGKIVVSNDSDFKDSLIVSEVAAINENRFHTFPLSYSGAFKYLKYWSPRNSYGNIAEIELYDDQNRLIRPLRSWGGANAWVEHSAQKVFDGDVLTSYSRMHPDGAWAAVELPQSVHISKYRIHPRTDGNAIYSNNVYQLLYWKDGKWMQLDEKNGDQMDSLTFQNVPENALLLLHNKTQGTEERVFTYEGGKQIWW